MASAPVLIGPRPARRESALTAAERDEVGDIVATVCIRHPGIDLSRAVPGNRSDALALLETVWHAVMAALSAAPASTGGNDDDLELLSRVRAASARIQSGPDDRVDTALAALRDAIAELGEIDDTAHLLARAAVAATALGFDRAMISSVSGGTWVPVTGHIERDPAWASQIVAAGRAHPEVIDAALPEAEAIRRRKAIVVDDVSKLPRCYATIIEIAKGRRYVAAPILANRSVIGFVHADAFYRTRAFTDTDLHLMGLFGEYLGTAMSRVRMLDNLRALRGELDGISTRIADLERTWSGQPHPPGPPGRQPTAAPAPPPDTRRPPWRAHSLTRRELEVLEFVAEGATNARIARALTISEGTVKGHVKHILRKLGAANRAEAVSHWLRLSAPSSRP